MSALNTQPGITRSVAKCYEMRSDFCFLVARSVAKYYVSCATWLAARVVGSAQISVDALARGRRRPYALGASSAHRANWSSAEVVEHSAWPFASFPIDSISTLESHRDARRGHPQLDGATVCP